MSDCIRKHERRSAACADRAYRLRALPRATARVAFLDLEARRLMANPSIGSITMINAATDVPIGAIANNGAVTVDLKATPSLNFRAEISAGRSVRFGLDGNANFRTENFSPFAFAGDAGADYLSWTPTVGRHVITARAYAGANASSASSAAYSITLNVTNSGLTPPPPNPQPLPTPFLGTGPSLPLQTILFDNFDNGGEGVSYHDTSAANESGQYRTAAGVDIENTTDATPGNLQTPDGIGKNIGHVRASEWLKFTTLITTAGKYKLQLRFASANAGGVVHMEVDGVDATGPITLGNTGGFQSWRTIDKDHVTLPAGEHVLRFVVDATNSGSDIGNLHWFRFTTDGTTPTPPPPPPTPGPLQWPTSWQQSSNAPNARFESMAHSFNGKLYVFGGFKDDDFRVDRSYEVYNPATGNWSQLGTLPIGMSETHVTPVDDGQFIYFVGGFKGDLRHDGVRPSQQGSARTWRYEPATNGWTEVAARLPRLQGASATACVGRKIYMISGDHDDRITATPDSYALDLDNIAAGWKRIANHPDAKDHMSTVVIAGKIYTLGGEYGHDELGDTQKSVHVYDPATNTWARLADMPFRSGHAEGSTFVHNGRIFFAGGQTTGQGATNRVAAYNPATNQWQELSPLPNFLQGTIVQPFGNKIIVTMGARYTESPLRTTWIGMF